MTRRVGSERGAAAGLLAIGLLAACAPPPSADSAVAAPAPERRSTALRPPFGETIEPEIAPTECHLIELDLVPGQLVNWTIDQDGVDLVTTLLPPGGGDSVTFDAPVSDRGREEGTVVAAVGGTHRLEICAPESLEEPGRYRVRVEAPRSSTPEDRARFEGFVAYSRALRATHEKAHEVAVSQFTLALAKFRDSGAPRPQAWASYKLGGLESEELRAASYYEDAAELYQAVDDPRAEAVAWSHVGRSLSRGARLSESLAAYGRAVELAKAAAPDLVEDQLANVVKLQDQLGLTLQAVETYRRRERAAVARGDAAAQWEALDGRGKIYLYSGDPARSLEIFARALELARRNDLEGSVTRTLEDIGRAYLESGEAARAAARFEEALEARRASGEPVALGWTLNNLGRCYESLGETERARAAFAEALELARQGERDRYLEALVLLNGTLLPRAGGRPGPALAPCEEALAIFRDYGRPPLIGSALHCVALAHAARGDLHAAVEAIREALEIIETYRSRAAVDEMRAQFLAGRHEYYELYVDLLLRLEAREPGRGHAAEAFQVAERSKARTVLDNLASADAQIRAHADADLVLREAGLRAELSELEKNLLQLHAAKEDDAAEAALRGALATLEREHALVEGRIFADYPGWTTLLQSKPSTLSEIRSELLRDGRTQLVSFLLGEERSYAWIVGRDSLDVATLPGRDEIETLARRTARLLATSDQPHLKVQGELTAQALSRSLLAPVVPFLTARKLILVEDGALHYVPFAALPLPEPQAGGSDVPLVERFELVEVPSASSAVGLRRRRARPPAYRGQLALLADPVFERDDERLAQPGTATVREAVRRGETAPGTRGIGELTRLPGSTQEARRIVALVPRSELLLATGVDANRDALVGGRLNGYRVIHLVGHGLANPGLAGLVLSLYDADGDSVDGLVRGYEIYGLDLDAELVVLSACQTGMGQEIRGEGLIGLGRSFLYAGASQILVSLWDVDDRATADLMERFYVALFREGQAPAEALQTAQRTLRRSRRWAAPHYWAGFVLQGDAS